jgi:hypothetical protein
MRYQEFQARNSTDQFFIMQHVLNRITRIPGFNWDCDSDFKNDFVGENKEYIRIDMTSERLTVAVANAQALRDYLDANNIKFKSEEPRIVIFSMEDLFVLFSGE